MDISFIDWLSEKLENRGWSMREFARRAQISHSTVSKILGGDLEPSWEFCSAIARPLGEPVWSVARIAGLIPKASRNSPTFQEIEELVGRLTEEQRLEVIRYLKYLIWQKMSGEG